MRNETRNEIYRNGTKRNETVVQEVVKVIILQLPGVTVNRKRGLHNESH